MDRWKFWGDFDMAIIPSSTSYNMILPSYSRTFYKMIHGLDWESPTQSYVRASLSNCLLKHVQSAMFSVAYGDPHHSDLTKELGIQLVPCQESLEILVFVNFDDFFAYSVHHL